MGSILAGLAALITPRVAGAMPIEEPEELFLTEVGFSQDRPGGVKKPIYEYCTAEFRDWIARVDEILRNNPD